MANRNRINKITTVKEAHESPKIIDGEQSYSLYDKEGNKVGQTLVAPGTNMSNIGGKYFTKSDSGYFNMSDVPQSSVSLDKETGKITVYAPDLAVQNETFKNNLKDTLKSISAAYKSNPDYKFSMVDESGENVEKSIDDVLEEINAPAQNGDGTFNQSSIQYLALAAASLEKQKKAHAKNVELNDEDVIRMSTVAVGPDVKDDTLQLISNLPEAEWLRNISTYDKETGFAQYGDIMENAYNKEKVSSEDMIRLWAALEEYFAKGDFSDKEEYIRNVATARFLDATQPNMSWIRDVTENVIGLLNGIGGYATNLGTAGIVALQNVAGFILFGGRLDIRDEYYSQNPVIDSASMQKGIARGGDPFSTDPRLSPGEHWDKIGRVVFDEDGVPSYEYEQISSTFENPNTIAEILRAEFKKNQATLRKDIEYLHESQAGWDAVGYAIANLAALIAAGNVMSNVFTTAAGRIATIATAGKAELELADTAVKLYASGTALTWGTSAAEVAQIVSGIGTIYDIAAATGKASTFLNFIGQAVASAKTTEFIIGVVGESVAEAVIGDPDRLVQVLNDRDIDSDTKTYLIETYVGNALGWGVGLGVGKFLMKAGETTRGRAISANLSRRLFKIQNSVGEAFDQAFLTIRRVKGDNFVEKVKTLYEEGGRYAKKQANALAASADLREMRKAIVDSTDVIKISGKSTDEINEALSDIEMKINELKRAEVALTSMQRQGVDIVQGWLKDEGKGLKEAVDNFYAKAGKVAQLEKGAGELFKPVRGVVSDMTSGKPLRLFSQTTTNYIKATEKIDFINAYIQKYEHSTKATKAILAKIKGYREELPELYGMVNLFVQNAPSDLRLAANNFIDADRKWWARYENLRASLGLTDAEELAWFRGSKLWGTNGELYARTTRKQDLSEYVVKHRDGTSNVKTFDNYEQYMAGATGDFADPMGEMQIALYDAGNKQAYRSFAKSYNKLTGSAIVKVSGEESALYEKMKKGLKNDYFESSTLLLKGMSEEAQGGIIEDVIKNLQTKSTQYGDIAKTKGALKTAAQNLQKELTEVTSENANKYIVRLGAEDTNALWDDFYDVSVRELLEGGGESLPVSKDLRPARKSLQLKQEAIDAGYVQTENVEDVISEANRKAAKDLYNKKNSRSFKKYPKTEEGLAAWYEDNPVAKDYSSISRKRKGEAYQDFMKKYSQELLPGAEDYVDKEVWDIVDIKAQGAPKAKDVVSMQVRRFIYGQARELGIDVDAGTNTNAMVELHGKLEKPDDIAVLDISGGYGAPLGDLLDDKASWERVGINDVEDFRKYLVKTFNEILPPDVLDDIGNSGYYLELDELNNIIAIYRADKIAETFNSKENKDFLKKIGWDRGYRPTMNAPYTAAYGYTPLEEGFYDIAEKFGGKVDLHEALMVNTNQILSLPELQSIELHELAHAVWMRASTETKMKIGQDLVSRLGLDLTLDEALACSRDMNELVAYATETRFDVSRGLGESLGANEAAQEHLENLARHAGVKNDKSFRERVLGVIESFVTYVKTKLLGINSAKTFDDFYEGLLSGDFAKDLKRDLGEFPFKDVAAATDGESFLFTKSRKKLLAPEVDEKAVLTDIIKPKSRLLRAYDDVNKVLAGTADTPDATFEQQVKRLIMSHNEDILNDTRVQKALTEKERLDYIIRNETFYMEKAEELKFLEEQYGITKEELSVAGGATVKTYIEAMTRKGTPQRKAIDELCKYYGLEGDKNALEYFALSAYMDNQAKYKHEIATQLVKAVEEAHPELKFKKGSGNKSQAEKVAGIITNGIDATIEEEFNDARLVLKEINPNATREADEKVMQEVDRIAKEIENAEANRYAGEKNVIAMRNMQGKVEYFQTDPLLARLVNFQFLPEKMNGLTQAIYNTNYLWAKLFRLGTTAINLKSMISQSFRDPINMFIGGGAYRTTQQCMDNIIDVAGDDVVAWIKTYEPEVFGRLQKKAEETGKSLQELAVEREFAIGRGLSPTATETSMYRSLNTARRARLNGVLDIYDDTLGDKTVRAIDKVGETLGAPNEWRETTLRNLSYQNGLSAALKRGYSLDEARTYAAFVMNEATTNFTRMTNHLVSLKDTVPYFGSAVNGAKSFYKLLSMDPVGVVGRLTGGLIIPTIALVSYSLLDERNKEVYKNIPEYQKEDALVFVVDGQIISIPIPQELGSFMAPFRQMVEGMYNASTNTFAELAWHDILGFSPVDLTGFANLDFAKLETSSPGFLNRIGDGIARMWAQLAPPVLKSGLEVVTGVDPYTGKAIDKSYFDYDEDGNQIVKDYQSGELAKALNSMFRSWGLSSSAPVVQNILSNIIGVGSVDVIDFLVSLATQVPNGGWAFSATERQLAMGEGYNPLYVVGSRLTDPITMDAYNEAQSAWKTEVTKLYIQKEEILNSKEWVEYIEAKKTTTDPDKLKNINASGKDIVSPYYETVKNVVDNLQKNYGEEFTAAKYATVLSLMTMDKQTLDLGAYGKYLEKESYKTARAQAIQTMINMGFPSISDADVLGKFVTSSDGDIFVRTYSPLAILQLDDASGASIYSQSNRQHFAVIRNLLADGNAYSIREDYYNDVDKAYDAKDYDKVEELMNDYNEKIIRLIYPYIKEYSPESVLQGDVMDYLEDYIMVPSSFMGKGKYYSSKTGLNKQQGYARNYIKAIFDYGENRLNENR